MKVRNSLMILGVLCAFYTACSSQSEWTPEEKLNFKHFLSEIKVPK